MIEQVLNRRFVLGQLQRVRSHLEKVSKEDQRPRFLRSHPSLGPELLNSTLDAVRDALARESLATSGQTGFDLPPMRRTALASAELDDRAFFSRDPVISNLQSALDEYFETKGDHEIQPIPLPAGAKELDFAVTDRRLAGLSPQIQPRGETLFGPFEPADPGWISAAVARGISMLHGKRTFNSSPATPVAISDNARVILVGDWGTGLPRAQKVAQQIRAVLDDGIRDNLQQHVIHLGDVYYAGWEREYRNRLLAYWPVRPEEKDSITSWSLNGNHDMYSGGHAYYDFLLKDARFARQEQSSFFHLYNQYWDIVALDTAWDDAKLTDSQGELKQPQADWVKSVLEHSERRTMLLSHHQLFSAYEGGSPHIEAKLKAVLDTNRVEGWFWGHEHRNVLYNSSEEVQYGRCLGHGGVPVYMSHQPNDPYPQPAFWEYRDAFVDGPERWALFGFAVLDFNGAQVSVRYISENGGAPYKTEQIPLQPAVSAARRSA